MNLSKEIIKTIQIKTLIELCATYLNQSKVAIDPIKFDWVSFILVSKEHRLIKQISELISKNQLEIPVFYSNEIHLLSKNSSSRMLSFTAELAFIVNKFNQANIISIPLKGPIAAKQIYDDFTAKNSRDIDFLVKENQLEKCIEIIETQGYINSYPFHSLSKKQKKAFQKSNNQLAFFHPQKKMQVEIHWRLFANKNLLPLTFDELLKDSAQMVIGKTSINCLSNKHLLLYLCAHGSKHHWSLLYWLMEVATLTQKVKFDWGAILNESKALGVERPLVQGLLLIEKLFKLNAPMVIKAYYQQNRIIQELVETSREIIMEEASFTQETSVSNYLKILNYKMKLSSRIQYKLAYFKLNSINDFELVKLPDPLFFVYFWLRPVFWFWRYIIHPIKKQ